MLLLLLAEAAAVGWVLVLQPLNLADQAVVAMDGTKRALELLEHQVKEIQAVMEVMVTERPVLGQMADLVAVVVVPAALVQLVQLLRGV